MRSIASVLVDFHEKPAPPAFRAFDAPTFAAEPLGEPLVDIDTLIREAEERGAAKARAAAQDDLAVALASLEDRAREQAAAAVAQARELWASEELAAIAAQIEAALSQLQTMIAERVAVVLQAVMTPLLRDRMLSELLQTLEQLTRHDATMLLRIEGPKDLAEHLRAALAGRVRSVDVIVSDGPDIRVTAQDSVIDSHLGEWGAAALEGCGA